MQYIVKYFPEITIKSKPVRKQMSLQLEANLRRHLRAIDASVRVQYAWDTLKITTSVEDESRCARIVEVLRQTPGIANFLDVVEYPLADIDDIAVRTSALWQQRLAGMSFAVRCRREGNHDFSSGEVERFVGGYLLHVGSPAPRGVDLHRPDITVRLEIRKQRVFIVNQRYEGLGGFPCGTLDPVLSLVSGGFDSTVASYLTMRRGLLTHFLFFNLGGHAHELAVKEISLYLWLKYGASHRVKFIAVPFEGVVAEILQSIDNSHMGVVLKRMMLRAGSSIAASMGIEALVTGEAVAQVSSQTLANLAVIDKVSDMLVLRPLIASDKTEIVRLSREIGAEELAANVPEYCGVISVKPKTRARLDRVEFEESRFDFAVLEQAVGDARCVNIDDIDLVQERDAAPECEMLAVPLAESAVIDIRHPAEEQVSPLQLDNNEVLKIPFYQLQGRFGQLDQDRRYMLYCDRGVMSRMHGAQLAALGYGNVCVYRPA
jgi:thiamine biosynthesis protein ThiI